MLLQITPAGFALETNALTSDNPLPKVKELVIDSGATYDGDDGLHIIEEAYTTQVLGIDRISAGVVKFMGSAPPDLSMWIRGIGLRLEDGTTYAYGKYQPESNGFFKGQGFAFSFFALHSREQDVNFEFTYSPLDIAAIAAQIETAARTNIDLYIQQYFMAQTQLTSGLQHTVTDLQKQLNSLKSGANT